MRCRGLFKFGQRRSFSASAGAASEDNLVLFAADNVSKIVRITLNRPALHNAFNEVLIAQITQCFQRVSHMARSDQARCVIFSGSGKSFSAGADLSWMQKMVRYSREDNEQDALRLFDMVHAVRSCPVPVVARVNGSAVGGGAGLVAASDVAVGVREAQFGFTEVKLGLIPAVISPFVMDRIGRSHCYRYFLTGERFDASRAREMGLLQEVVSSVEELDQRVEQIASDVASNSPLAVQRCKQLVKNVSRMSYDDAETRQHLAREIADIRVSQQGQEGLAAFLGKRKPSWQNQ